MKAKIIIKYNDKKIKGEVEAKNPKELRTQLNRLYRKLKKEIK